MNIRAGQLIDVTGVHGDSVRIGNVTVTFGTGQAVTKTFGPFTCDMTATVLSGNPSLVTRPSVGPTETKRIPPMALNDKFKTLATRMRQVPQDLESRADKLSARLDTLQQRGDKAFEGHERFLDGVESGVSAAEDALNQLTNGAPPDA